MVTTHEYSVEERVGAEGERRFVPLCACGWQGVPSTGVNAEVLAWGCGDLHVEGESTSPPVDASATRPLELWLGIVQLEAREGSELFDSAYGAVVNVVSLAAGAADYARRVSAFFDARGVNVVEFSDVEALPEQHEADEGSDAILTLAASAKVSGDVECGPYHLFNANWESEGQITVSDEAGIEEVLARLTEYARDWLVSGLDRYANGFEIGTLGIVFDVRSADGERLGAGYICSDGRPSVHEALFREAALHAEELQDEANDATDEDRSA